MVMVVKVQKITTLLRSFDSDGFSLIMKEMQMVIMIIWLVGVGKVEQVDLIQMEKVI